MGNKKEKIINIAEGQLFSMGRDIWKYTINESGGPTIMWGGNPSEDTFTVLTVKNKKTKKVIKK